MPAAMIKTIFNVCNISKAELEEKWELAKKSASNRADDYSYVTGIFKHSLGKECMKKLEKVGWKPIEWKKENLSKSNKLLNLINL